MNFGTSIAQRPTTLLLNSSTNKTDCETLVAVKQTANGRKKRCRASEARVKKFLDIYETTGESLGEGSFGHVRAYRNIMTRKEFAVKVISKRESKSRHRVLKEIEIFHHCQGHENILQMVEFFEEEDKFYLVFEKMEGGTLLDCILNRGHLSEREASRVVRDIASGLDFLHKKGIAHRDLKPENILCMKAGQLTPVKICDFDLGSAIQIGNSHCTPVTTPELLSPVGSADFMAPEVVDVWRYQAESYDKRCDLWSLGILLYILLCGYRPFYAHCSRVGCDFNEGGECEDCLELLFQSTQQGVYSFPDPDWDKISVDAKDLIQHLLVKNPYQRYTAEQVLHHPWLSKDLSGSAQLATPIILSRNNSVRELSMFAETANAVNRLIQQQISMNELSTRTPTYTYNNQSTTDVISARDQLRDQSKSPHDSATGVAESCSGKFQLHKQGGNDHVEMIMFQTRKHDNDVDGGVGGLSEEEDVDVDMTRRLSRLSEDDEEALIQRMSELYDDDDLVDVTREALSALPSSTTSSQVARRQAFKSHNLSECSLDSGNVSTGSSPPDY